MNSVRAEIKEEKCCDLGFSGSRASLQPMEGIKVSFPLPSCLVCEFEGNMRVEVKPRVEFWSKSCVVGV